jgi:hypothetical protein
MAKIITIVAGIVAIMTFLAGFLQSSAPSAPAVVFDPWVWYVIAGIALAVAIIVGIGYRKHQLNHRGVAMILKFGDEYPYKICDITYKDIVWEVFARSPNPPPRSSLLAKNEKCKKCGMRLEESESFFWGYLWKCIGCGFKKRNRDSFGKESERVERIADRELEKQYDGNQ